MNIAVINTGGTISCVGSPLSPMSATSFATACEQLLTAVLVQQYFDLTVTYVRDITFPGSSTGTLDSANLQPTDWCLIASYILNHYANFDGWVVLHGTDSMDFTGAALPFLLNAYDHIGVATAVLSKPVIITGAQVPLFHQISASGALVLNFNTDAYRNLCGAIASAQSGVPEVGVYFDGSLFRGSRVVKVNASEFKAFASPNYPALAEYGSSFHLRQERLLPPPVNSIVSLDNPATLAAMMTQINYVATTINLSAVMQLNAFPAPYNFQSSPNTALLADIVKACTAAGIGGLVLESYGDGNFPSGNPDRPSSGAIYQALAAASASGVVLVNCTQVMSGAVESESYATGAWLAEAGALCAFDLTPMATFCKLTVLLALAGRNSWSTSTVATLMQLNLLGEMVSVSRLDSRGQAKLLPRQSLTALDGSARLMNDPTLGPVLTEASGTVLWRAFPSAPAASDMPGSLVMQDDGNLVYYSRNHGAMWATNTGSNMGASSMLIVAGSDKSSVRTLKLEVYDYSRRRTTAVLYGG